MTLKNAAGLALFGTILMTVLLVWNFVFTFLNVVRDLVPAVTLFSSFIYAFACFTVAVFFYVFHRARSHDFGDDGSRCVTVGESMLRARNLPQRGLRPFWASLGAICAWHWLWVRAISRYFTSPVEAHWGKGYD